MRQIWNLEIVEPQEIPIKVFVIFYNVLLGQLYRGCEDKQVFFFLQSFNLAKCIAVGLLMLKGLLSLLFYCESGMI